MLARVQGQVRTVRLSRVSPLADSGAAGYRPRIRSAHAEDEDALLAETEALVAEATGEAETSQAPMRVHPVHRANLAKLTRRDRPQLPGLEAPPPARRRISAP